MIKRAEEIQNMLIFLFKIKLGYFVRAPLKNTGSLALAVRDISLGKTFKIPEYLTVSGDGLADVGVPVRQLRVINDQGGRGWNVCTNNSPVRWFEKKVATEASKQQISNKFSTGQNNPSQKIILDSTVTLGYVFVHILVQ